MSLTAEAHKILERPRWTDPIDLYIGDIIEYDMKDGGFSIIQEESLLSYTEIQKLKQIPKGFARNEAVGKLKYSKDPAVRDTGKRLERLFGKYRLIFGEANNITEDDIHSVKRDAVFLKRYASQLQFGEYIKFAEKHIYDIYFLLGENELVTNYQSRHRLYEVYFNTYTNDIAFKGIRDELVEEYHTNGIIKLIKKYLKFIVKFDYEGATKFIVSVIDDYKHFRLPIEMYREFNSNSSYIFQMDGKQFEANEADLSLKDILDIRYNFNYVLVPMLNMASSGIKQK